MVLRSVLYIHVKSPSHHFHLCFLLLIQAGGVLEGCVTITRVNTFEVLKRIDLPLKNVLRNAAYLQGIYSVRPDLQDVLG